MTSEIQSDSLFNYLCGLNQYLLVEQNVPELALEMSHSIISSFELFDTQEVHLKELVENLMTVEGTWGSAISKTPNMRWINRWSQMSFPENNPRLCVLMRHNDQDQLTKQLVYITKTADEAYELVNLVNELGIINAENSEPDHSEFNEIFPEYQPNEATFFSASKLGRKELEKRRNFIQH